MPFVLFHEFFPEVAEAETRSVTRWGDPELPDASYGFVELFCDEEGCDCRRAFIWVVSEQVRTKSGSPLATISYGWEDERFYEEWASFPLTAEDLDELKGPALVRLTPQSEHAPKLLELFEMLLEDEEYAQRIERHYQMFRSAIDGGTPKIKTKTSRPKQTRKIPSRRRSQKSRSRRR
jgi:hypothetical protein